jgi:hypothetical protein
MYTLKNEKLNVTILDPVADQARLGTRYCTGGYIFMISDEPHGNLLSGPTYPADFNTFDGQGIPDAFNLSPLRAPGTEDALALILGIGVCDLAENRVEEWCAWQVDAQPTVIKMTTQHAFRGYAVDIERTVTLHGRTVRSTTTVRNNGRPVPLRWFPHPFYPHPVTDELVKFNIPVQFPDNPGYEMAPNGFICRKGWPWKHGPYQALDHNAMANLIIIQKHPQLGLVTATCSYVPDFFPIWGNANTFSWEPFFERSLAPNQAVTWWIDYDF